MEIVIITGVSGAGKTSVINICQDNDYYTIDNLPPKMIKNYLEDIDTIKSDIKKFAFVVDIRVGKQLKDLENIIDYLKSKEIKVKVIFLDASDEELIKRFQEKRRPHSYKDLPLDTAIKKERKELEKIRNLTDYYIDTTNKKIWELKESVLDVLEISENIKIQVISFGFKYGILREADYIFDVRFIQNPFYIKELKNFTGLDENVKEFVFSHKESIEFANKIINLIDYIIPFYKKASKTNIVIGIGCTGGKHRSVAISELINKKLNEKFNSTIFHRDRKLW